MQNANTLAPNTDSRILCGALLPCYQHFPNAFSALSVVPIIGSSISAVVRLQSGPENSNRIAQAQRTGAQASIMKSLQRENNFKNSVKARTILCDKQQTRQRFLVAEKRGKEGEAFRQLTLG